ncbi:GNAT family N-acetyltransferase [Sulfitobacter albidus]|uniref:GNAT family N-acetyltransferase n=1 Tax=Sulfitobacter albidus TaxID=2829501 RepID=A0A975JFH8_9RHOB|nr:GNAT family N-acetyltransferase [Sulfitobacter albidus]QUJ77305.1 GNAT family N-acetyltransferase [Sulfitobacter albidus]
MNLRPATPADASSLAALSIEVWLGTYLRAGVSGVFADYALETFTAANLARLIADPDQTLIVSQNVAGIDGYIRLDRAAPCPVDGGPVGEIATLYVQPRHHGRGIGRALLAAGFGAAQVRDALWLATNAENAPAIVFYRAQGFDQIGETDFHLAGQGYRNVVLTKAC